MLLTIGLVFMSVGGGQVFLGTAGAAVSSAAVARAARSSSARASFPTYRSFLIRGGAVLVTGLWLGLERTRFGAQIRAAVDNLRMAQSVGINTSRLFTLTFALGSGLAALGGALGADFLADRSGLCARAIWSIS